MTTIAAVLVVLAFLSVIAALAFSFWRAAMMVEEERRRLEYDLEILRAVKVSGRPRLTVIAGGRS